MSDVTTKRVYYVEPNYYESHSEGNHSFVNANGQEINVNDGTVYEMAPKPEDFCVAFQLAVEVPTVSKNGTVRSEGRVFVLTSNIGENPESATLLQGTRIYENPGDKENSSSVQYLTTNVLDTILSDIREESPTEMFGVKSIDVSYQSWMTPQVTIQFTDIRAASLFGPEERKHENNGLAKDDIAGSFFRCFFVTPYPIFALVMKGFYGEAVSYELSYSNFSYKLNSETGNYDAEAKFVGYTWGLLGDITFNAVMAAPYDTYYGKQYWEEQVKAGRFTVDDGHGGSVDMPTLARVVNSFNEMKNNTVGLSSLDVATQQNIQIKEESATVDTNIEVVESAVAQLYDKFSVLSGFSSLGSDKSDGFVCITKVGNTKDNIKVDGSEYYKILNEIHETIGSQGFKTTFSFGDNIDFDATDETSACKQIGNITAKGTSFEETVELSNQISGNTSGNILTLSKNAYLDNHNNVSMEALEKSVCLQGATPLAPVYGVVVDAREYKKNAKQKKQDLDTQKEKSDDELKAKFHQQLADLIGMPPTLYNMCKVMMAHLETLIHCVYYCVDEIPDGRSVLTTGLDESNWHDYCSERGGNASDDDSGTATDTILPPFPGVRSKKQKDGRTIVEDEWLGDLSTDADLREIELIEGLLKGIQDLRNDAIRQPAGTVVNEDGSISEFNVVCPVVPSDLFIPSPIFGSLDTDNEAAFIGAAALRGSYVIHAVTDVGKNATNSRVAGEIDAYNFCAQFGNFSPEWRSLFSAYESGEDFWENKAKDVIYNKDNKNYPWHKKYENPLLDVVDRPVLPVVDWKTDRFGSFFPVYNITFDCEAYKNGVTTQGNFSAVKPISAQNSPPLFCFTMTAQANLYTGVNQMFEGENSVVKEISDLDHIQDNFKELAELSQLGGEYSDLYDENADYFTKTYAATRNVTKEVLDGVVAVPKNSDSDRSFTLPNSKNQLKKLIDSGQTAFKKGKGEHASKFNLHKYLYANYSNNADTDKKGTSIKRDKQTIGNYIGDSLTFSNEKIIEWTIPTFDGVTFEDGQVTGTTNKTTLFAQSPYINEKNEWHRAEQFLCAINSKIKVSECMNLLTKKADNDGKKGFFSAVPYFFVLFLGAYLLGRNVSNSKLSSTLLKKVGAKSISWYPKSNKIWDTFNKYDTEVGNWKEHIKIAIMEEYVNWVLGKGSSIKGINNYMSFPEIEKAFALNSGAITAFKEMSKGEDDWGDKTVENILYPNMPESFYENYVSLKVDEYSDEGNKVRLFTREGTTAMNKLAAMYAQPVLLVLFQQWPDFAGKNNYWIKENTYHTDKFEGSLKAYMTAFFDRCAIIQGFQETPTDTNNNPLSQITDIDKHIKISLYKYIKLLYDRWLSCDLWRDHEHVDGVGTRDHWDLEPFFVEHFHFIDQFYVDCKDIFFDMNSVVKMWDSSFEATTMSFLEFMTNALADCNCVLYPVQNFLDYSKRDGKNAGLQKLDNLFKPIPYVEAFSDMKSPHEIYPDFVVLYSSTPSTEIEDGECGDSMDLRDDPAFLPVPLTESTNTNHDIIPAFGVSYGKQYQSYFKNIQVDTTSPIPTEQSLKAQYMIAAKSSKTGAENGEQIGCLGQDLYSIYSNQSYTCTVEMMGNMWIQPTMYFVLTNSPTFRGSYIVQKVTHKMSQGSMTTTITGTRMANTSQPHVYNWFLGRQTNIGGSGDYSIEDIQGAVASPDNDCKYKVFTPGGKTGLAELGGLSIDGLMMVLSSEGWSGSKGDCDFGGPCTVTKKGCYGPGLTRWVAGIVGHSITPGVTYSGDQVWQDFLKVTENHRKNLSAVGATAEKFGQGGYDVMMYLDHWLPAGLKKTALNASNATELAKILRDKNYIVYDNKSWYTQAMAESGKNTETAQGIIDDFASVVEGTTPAKPTFRFKAYHGEPPQAVKNLVESKVSIKQGDNTDNGDDDKAKIQEIANSIKKTCEFSSGINISTVYSLYDETTKRLKISAVNDKFDTASEHNRTLFDIALNAYDNYCTDILWVIKDENSYQDYPIYVEIGTGGSGKRIGVVLNGQIVQDNEELTMFNEGFYKSIAKRYYPNRSLNASVFKDTASTFNNVQDNQDKFKEVMNKYIPESCPANIPDSNNWGTSNGITPLPKGKIYYDTGISAKDLCPIAGVTYEELTQAKYDGNYFKEIDVYIDENGKYTRNKTNNPAGKLVQSIPFTFPDGKQKTLEMNVFTKDSLQKIFNEIKELNETSGGYTFTISGTAAWRVGSTGSPGTKTRHARGLAIDINPGSYGNPWFDCRVPHDQKEPAPGAEKPWKVSGCDYNGTYDSGKCLWHWAHPVVQIFIRNGWGWGGSYGDVMHFSMGTGG